MSQKRKRILLITDDELVDRRLMTAFEKAAPGLQVEVVRNQDDIRARNERSHLIIIDLLLSRENPF
jgi:ActR/RegA family two-component response regulator